LIFVLHNLKPTPIELLRFNQKKPMNIFSLVCAAKIIPAILCCFLLAQPVLAAVPGDEHWDNQFGPVGANDVVFAVIPFQTNIYVGGYLTAAGNTKANLVAGFDGTNWFALNNGIPPGPSSGYFYVTSMATNGNYLYVGGNFTNADNCGARECARWDGTNWSAMGSLPGIVFSLKFVGTNLYAGGVFLNTNGTTYTCLARWAGANWTLIPGDFAGFLPVAYSVESDGNNIFIGGNFTGASGVNSTNVLGWNGSSWFSLGPGLGSSSATVRTLLYKDAMLYAGGAFTNLIGGPATNTAVWNGASWSPWANANRSVRDLVTDGVNIFAGGEFSVIGGFSANRIAMWDGVNWSSLGAGLQGFGVGATLAVYKMAFDSSGRLLVGGNFNAVDGVGASYVAVWDGARWSGLGGSKSRGLTHFIGNVNTFLVDGSYLYVGGIFTEAGNLAVNSIARWDGTNWSALNSGLTGTFTTGVAPAPLGLAFLGTYLYVGGNFTSAGSVPATGIAGWDGSNWFNVGDADATVRAVVNDGGIGFNYLYAGGSFTNIGGAFSPGFAAWDGNSWFTLGILGGRSPVVRTIAVDGFDVYIGGTFTNIGSYLATNLARWNWMDFQWHALANGVNGTVSSINASNGIVYVGGPFASASGVSANRIAKWNGTTWSALGSGVAGSTSSTTVSSILVRGGSVYVTGTFITAGGITNVLGLAKWDGSAWSAPFGSGLVGGPGTATAAALAFIGNDFYVGGNFSWAGDKPSMFIARWNDQQNFYPPPQLQLTKAALLTNRQYRFRVAGTSGERYTILGSTNLITWTPLLTNSATLYDFTDTNAAAFPARFFRAVLGP
jgi:trimeric autotransporter adhesin